ncbi:hypothetical protein [Nocardiopsis alborubida]|uniref:hypothetical protein n=1 Tax=Nocardiopsis alborubida TaxID=146802 RepID=UPI000A7DBB21|nr:hypothetical protein [Nocardiopsis alborubida]
MEEPDTVTFAPEQHRPPGAPTEPGGTPSSGVVVGVDLRGIQAYVYSGRRILDAVGRAALVAELTDTSDAEHGIADLVPPGCVVLRDAGGALTAVFPDAASARGFTARYTRRLRDRAADLTPVVAHVAYGPEAEHAQEGSGTAAAEHTDTTPAPGAGRAQSTDMTAAAGPDRPGAVDPREAAGAARGSTRPSGGGPTRRPAGVDEALALLPARLREARRHMSALHTPAHGYGITAVCSVSGGPAETVDSSRAQDDHADVHERVAADVARARGIGRRWHRAHSSAWLAGAATAAGAPDLTLPMEVDRLGRDHGGLSRVAVVHIDVNGLGALLGEYRERAGDPAVPGSGAFAQRRLSTRIAGLTEGLARVLVRAVAATVHAGPGRRPVIPGTGAAAPITLHHEPPGPAALPVRPVVVAGDDLTVLCDARLALSLVRYALDWLDADPVRVGDDRDPRVGLHRALAEAHGDRPGGGRTVVAPDGAAHTTFVPTVGVGVAVQPVGAPLSLGYDLCEAMCRRAKQHRLHVAEADPGAGDEHAVAWTTRLDGVGRVLRRLDRARQAPVPRTCLPLTGTGFARFLDRYLSATAPDSLLADGDTRQRGWLVSALVPLLESGADPGPELARRARVTGGPVDLPRGWTPGGLLDAVEVMDLHLDPGLAAALDPHRPQWRARSDGPRARVLRPRGASR